jgi:site-specific recombinase XerD
VSGVSGLSGLIGLNGPGGPGGLSGPHSDGVGPAEPNSINGGPGPGAGAVDVIGPGARTLVGTVIAPRFPMPGEGAELDAEQIAALFLMSYKETTRRAYAVDLKQWFTWCDLFDVDPLAARRPHIDAWAIHLGADGGARPATLARKISAVRNFYAYAVDEGHLASSPVPAKDKALHLPKVSRKSQTLGPDREESGALLAAAEARGPRDAAVVAVLLYQGLRVSELCGMDLEDISTQRGHRVVRLRRKGGEEQDQAVAPPAAGAIDGYLAARAEAAGGAAVTSGPLFVDDSGRRLSRYQVEWIVESGARAAGIGKRISPHSLRHACTTILLDQGVPLRDIQVYLGHANSATTERYDLGRQHLDKSPAYALTGVFGGASGRR